jgi:Kef-type K+ transport system membrane component KefB
MSSILAAGLIMLSGVALGRVAAALGISSVVGYLLAGITLGHAWPGIGVAITSAGTAFAAEMGLSLIAFVVGGELEARRIRSLPRGAVSIAFAQASLCMAAVLAAAAIAGKPPALGLVLGAIAAATAPSTTIMIIRRHKADGPLTRMLLSVVAVDDAVCIMLYAVAVSVARALSVAGASQSVLGVAGVFVWELAGSVMVGVVVGIALGYFVKYARGGDELVVIVVGAVLLAAGLGSRMHVSPIISCLVLGATLTNLVMGSRKLFATIDRFSPPVYVLLFALAGVGCNFRSLAASISFFALYLVARVGGKAVGSFLAALAAQTSAAVRLRIGLSLLPQAGLAAGLTVAAGVALPDHRSMLASIVVPGILLFEAVGPFLLVTCLKKAGEAHDGDPAPAEA